METDMETQQAERGGEDSLKPTARNSPQGRQERKGKGWERERERKRLKESTCERERKREERDRKGDRQTRDHTSN